jgi:hypothetical protein
MDNGLCEMDGLCQGFFHPLQPVLSTDPYQAPNLNSDQTFATCACVAAPEELNASTPQTTFEPPVHRLIKERMRWVQADESEQTAAQTAVQGFQQLVQQNSPSFVVNNLDSRCETSGQGSIQPLDRTALENIWKKQMRKTTVNINAFCGKNAQSAQERIGDLHLNRAI